MPKPSRSLARLSATGSTAANCKRFGLAAGAFEYAVRISTRFSPAEVPSQKDHAGGIVSKRLRSRLRICGHASRRSNGLTEAGRRGRLAPGCPPRGAGTGKRVQPPYFGVRGAYAPEPAPARGYNEML